MFLALFFSVPRRVASVEGGGGGLIDGVAVMGYAGWVMDTNLWLWMARTFAAQRTSGH